MRLSPRMRRLNWRTLVIVAAGVVEMFLLTLGGIKMLEFTDSSEFCGQLCHTPMTPEFKAYQISPHTRVTCAQCHVGSGASYFVQSKVSGLPLVVATMFNTYERPIPTPVRNLRPARDTCEQCHWPQKFSEDRLRTYIRYLPDETNSRQEFQLAFRVGGGDPTIARDIHWHVSSKLWYLPLDEKNLEIAWVGVENPDGSLTEYFDPERVDQATPAAIASSKRFMDCLDCHNRATHVFRSPDQLVDEAMSQGRIDATLPFIKKLAVDALDVTNPSLPVTQSKIAAIERFYQQQYPQVYQQKRGAVNQAQATLRDLIQYVIFPEMRVTWQTHTNNLTHDGCFRCHDKLTTTPAAPRPPLISNDCNTCHYTMAAGKQPGPPRIPHTLEGRADCLSCHGPGGILPFRSDHTGRTNDTCTRCHVPGPVPPPVPHVLSGLADCNLCHGLSAFRPFPADHSGRSNESCTGCHSPSASPETLAGPSIPHALEGRTDCTSCHGPAGPRPFPAGHAARANATCIACHAPGPPAPAVPHATAGLSNCLLCHGPGAFRAFPADHSGRGNDSCSLCHTPAPSPAPLAGPPVPHQTAGLTDCLACHAASSFRPFPASHAERSDATCTACHATSPGARPLSGPRIPHTTQGLEDCLLCHAAGAVKPFPRNHADRPNASCMLCHTPGQ